MSHEAIKAPVVGGDHRAGFRPPGGRLCDASGQGRDPEPKGLFEVIVGAVLIVAALAGLIACAGCASTTTASFDGKTFNYAKVTQPWTDEAKNTTAHIESYALGADGTTRTLMRADITTESVVESKGAQSMWGRLWDGLKDVGLILTGFLARGVTP